MLLLPWSLNYALLLYLSERSEGSEKLCLLQNHESTTIQYIKKEWAEGQKKKMKIRPLTLFTKADNL